ncbi:MAG TPA: cupin domain-containing protein [Bacteroidota bacterium]|nr:cupin domain-containing protein [Bacteroidota bacterium]
MTTSKVIPKMMMTADEWISRLNLSPHPEGGYYRELYRSAGEIPAGALPERYQGGARSYATSIYFLLKSGECSRYHRLRSDELWYFHAGSALTLSTIDPVTGALTVHAMGFDIARGEVLQLAIPAGCWFGAEVDGDTSGAYALISCVVAPGFDFADFELGTRARLLAQFPQHAASIRSLTSAE